MSKKAASTAEVIRRRRIRLENKNGYISLLFRVILIAAVVWVMLAKVFMFMQVPDNEMFPAVKAGDLAVGYRLQSTWLKNDVVIYEQDGKLKAGRILGKENDVITLDETGTLTVNGTVQDGEIMYPTYAKDALEYPYRVPEGCVFILGDYRTEAEDSRDFGAVSMDNVKAKVITILRRRSL